MLLQTIVGCLKNPLKFHVYRTLRMFKKLLQNPRVQEALGMSQKLFKIHIYKILMMSQKSKVYEALGMSQKSLKKSTFLGL